MVSRVLTRKVYLRNVECQADEKRFVGMLHSRVQKENRKYHHRAVCQNDAVLRRRAIHTDGASKGIKGRTCKAKENSDNIVKFIRIVRKYTEITELTSEIVREFIEKIIVHQAERKDGKKTQAAEIIYNGAGAIPTFTP